MAKLEEKDTNKHKIEGTHKAIKKKILENQQKSQNWRRN
jgi:hypothetical protein